MKTIHCVDVSGSMCQDQLEQAHREVLKRFKPKDIVVLFSVRYLVVTDIERPFTSYTWKDYPWLFGGTWPEEVLAFAKSQDGNTILYSDGYLSGIDQFNEFVKV